MLRKYDQQPTEIYNLFTPTLIEIGLAPSVRDLYISDNELIRIR